MYRTGIIHSMAHTMYSVHVAFNTNWSAKIAKILHFKISWVLMQYFGYFSTPICVKSYMHTVHCMCHGVNYTCSIHSLCPFHDAVISELYLCVYRQLCVSIWSSVTNSNLPFTTSLACGVPMYMYRTCAWFSVHYIVLPFQSWLHVHIGTCSYPTGWMYVHCVTIGLFSPQWQMCALTRYMYSCCSMPGCLLHLYYGINICPI